MTLPRASRSLISPVVAETGRRRKAKELPAQSSPYPSRLCGPLASFQCWAGPGQSSCRLPCAQLAVIRLFLLGGGGVGVGGRDGGAGWGGGEGDALHCWSFAKGCWKRERALFCNERKERGCCCEEVCGSDLRICIHKQRKVLRILLSACRLSPRLSPAVFLCLLIC